MTATLEQELQDLIETQGYRVRFHDSGYLHVYVYYENVQIDHKLFMRPWRWRKATRYVRKTVVEHRRMMAELGAVVIRKS